MRRVVDFVSLGSFLFRQNERDKTCTVPLLADKGFWDAGTTTASGQGKSHIAKSYESAILTTLDDAALTGTL